MEEWKYNYEGNSIRVTNTASLAQLFVNDELMDQRKGLVLEANLKGKLRDGREVRASISGAIKLGCVVSVEGAQISECR